MVDLPDGSLVVEPDRKRTDPIRLVFLASVVSDVALAIGLFIVGTAVRQLSVLRIAGILAALAAAGAFLLWRRYVPRGVKADALNIRYLSMIGQSIPRSDLAVIFRGEAWTASRTGGSWVKSYVFAARDGKVAFSCPSAWFTEDSMAQFAGRLQVPLRGDFTARVKDWLDSSAT